MTTNCYSSLAPAMSKPAAQARWTLPECKRPAGVAEWAHVRRHGHCVLISIDEANVDVHGFRHVDTTAGGASWRLVHGWCTNKRRERASQVSKHLLESGLACSCVTRARLDPVPLRRSFVRAVQRVPTGLLLLPEERQHARLGPCQVAWYGISRIQPYFDVCRCRIVRSIGLQAAQGDRSHDREGSHAVETLVEHL